MARYSVNESDDGHLAYLHARDGGLIPVVSVDGVVIEDVVTCDDQDGFVERLLRNEKGKFYLDSSGDCAAKEIMRGEVQIDLVRRDLG